MGNSGGLVRGVSVTRFALLSTVSLASILLSSAAHAQSAPPAPVRATIDEYGVNVFDGSYEASGPAIVLGGEDNGLAYRRSNRGSAWTDSTIGYVQKSGSEYTVSIGPVSDRFTLSSGVYTPTESNGASLSFNSTTNTYTYTGRDGTVARFEKTRWNETAPYGNEGLITDITGADGTKLTFTYDDITYCKTYKPSGDGYLCLTTGKAYRLDNVTSSYGYELRPVYGSYEWFYDPTNPLDQPDFGQWQTVLGMNGLNRASSTSTVLASQTFSSTYESGSSYYNVTDSLSRQTKFRMSSGAVVGIKQPGSTSEDLTLTLTSGKVTAVTTPIGTTSYSRSDSGSTRTVTVTDALSHVSTYVFDIPSQRLTSYTDPTSKTTSYLYDTSGRLTRVTAPEGNQVRYTYDARGNVTEQRYVAKTAGTPADVVLTAGYDATCSNVKKCNQPNWTKDALSKQTDYTYDSTHGGVLTVTAPAPSTGATRPQTRYSYTALQAYYIQGTSSPTASGTNVYRLTGVSACLTGSSCTGTANEAKTTIGYGPQTSGTGNNLLPVSVTRAAGNGSISAATTLAYNAIGDLTSVDGPLSGTDDTSVTRYDALRRKVGAIGPDPDGAGALVNPATRITYDTTGRLTLTEEGYTSGQTDTAWNGFTAGASVARTYNDADQVLTETLKKGTTAYALTQYTYDGEGRLSCTAQRMNSATWSSLPSSACSLGTQGSFGPDRIVKNTYDNADRVTLVQSAYGTSDQANEVTTGYTNNGKIAYVVDAESNRTTYEYDGHDRLVKTFYPVAAKGDDKSSTTDYEQLTYGDNVRVTQRRLRDGNTIALGYDDLSRLTSMTGSTIDNRTMTYDLLGQPLSITYSSGGQSVTNAYDALGRLTSQTVPQGSVAYQYDAASRRTHLTWPDGFYAQYDYDTLGRVTKIRENGATSGVGVLATYTYDNLSRRTYIEYGSLSNRSYAYDDVNRLTGLRLGMAGGAADHVIGLVNGVGTAIAYNPASQITSLRKSNDSYAWGAHYNLDRSYTSNGLNQYTVVDGAAVGHDARGNITSSDGKTFGYDGLNQLTSFSEDNFAAALSYDPAGRLYQVSTSTSISRFLYDGGMVIAEYNGSNSLLRRFVPGPGVDEPLVWYEGTGTTDRRFLQGDERGSIISVSNSSATSLAINTYDEYGIPGASNSGRFQYTGQIYLPEIGLYYYKARMYSPTLGRFMQTDPIGYGDGMNWYNYVGGDPLNFVDPNGLEGETCLECRGVRIIEAAIETLLANQSGTARNEFLTVIGRLPGKSYDSVGDVSPFFPGLASDHVNALASDGNMITVKGRRRNDAPCSLQSDVAQTYAGAREIAMDLFQSIGADKEVAYTIFRNAEFGNLETYFTIGTGASVFGPGSVTPIHQREGLTPVLFGHIHDVPAGPCGLFCWAPRGPSSGDRNSTPFYPNATFVLHQQVHGRWEDTCF